MDKNSYNPVDSISPGSLPNPDSSPAVAESSAILHGMERHPLVTEKYVSLSQMQQYSTAKELENLLKLYFSNPTQIIRLARGEALMRRGQFNDRLYFVRQGSLRCEIDNFNGTSFELFVAHPNSFIGLYSFFSKTFCSSANIFALEDCELAYIDQRCLESNKMSSEIYKQFMPYVVNALKQRGMHLQETVMEKERAIQQLINNEKYTCLGEMAAGIAHELNNAVAVLDLNTQWLSVNLPRIMASVKTPDDLCYFQIGLDRGRSMTSREVRKAKQELQKRGYSEEQAEIIAQMGLTESEMPSNKMSMEELERANSYWETGATCHDMMIAAKQAAHVVKSVRELAQTSQNKSLIFIKETISEALVLLSSSLRQITVQLNLPDQAKIIANKGELVQIWTNLIKNAYESMIQAKIEHPTLKISYAIEDNRINISIEDNGPGIPQHILPKLFQPHITSKSNGMFIGLGLGLTIVHRIVTSYQGAIKVESIPGHTVFVVSFPIGEIHGKS